VAKTTGAGKAENTGSIAVKSSGKVEDDIKVIGRLEDTSVAKDWPGHDVLDLPKDKWTIGTNDAWVESGVTKGQTFYIASPTTPKNIEGTVFGRELGQLNEAGYSRVGDYMLPSK
jgi:hypothetical protein